MKFIPREKYLLLNTDDVVCLKWGYINNRKHSLDNGKSKFEFKFIEVSDPNKKYQFIEKTFIKQKFIQGKK